MYKTLVFWLSLCPCLIISSLLLEIPAILLFPFSPRLSRKYTGFFVSCSWFRLMAAMLDQICGVNFFVYGDFNHQNVKKNPVIIVSNHGTLFDLHCLIRGMFDIERPSQTFPITTERFRRSHIYLGWLKQMHHFIFVKKDWIKDRVHIDKSIRYLLETCSSVDVVIYPEGKIPSEAFKKEDKEYAESKGLATFKHLLHPKLKGFIACVQTCRSGGAPFEICEVTVAYKGRTGNCAYKGPFGGIQLPTGELPQEVHFHIKYHPSSSLPSSDEELGEWLYQRWRAKDELLVQFHKTKSFPGPVQKESLMKKLEMWLAIGIWAVLIGAVVYFWIKVPLLMAVIMGTTALIHYIVDKRFDGWERVALRRWERSKKMK